MARTRSPRPARRRRSVNDQVCLAPADALGDGSLSRAMRRLAAAAGLTDPPTEAIAERQFFWQPGQTLRIAFIDGQPPRAYVDKVKEIAPEWTKYARLDFEFVRGAGPADVTISFSVPDNYSSYLGTDSHNHRPSMLLGFPRPLDEAGYRSLILHEFGHALGLHHEHQNPQDNPVQWDPEAVYRYFARYGWDRQKTFSNVIQRLAADSRRYLFTTFDPKSIMLYAFPASLTRNGVGTERASDLSDADKAIAAQIYPGRGTPDPPPGPRELKVDGPALAGSVKPGVVNQFSFTVRQEDGYQLETTGSTDVVMGLYGPDDDGVLIRQDDDSASDHRNARILKWLDPAKYFVKVRASDFRPGLAGDYQVSVKRFH